MGLRKISVIALLAVAVGVMAVPARRDGFMRTAVDGTEKMVYLHGNEDFHYMTDTEGNWLDETTLLPLTEEEKSERLQVKGERAIRKAAQATGTGRLLAPKGPVILVNFSDTMFSSTREQMIEWAMGENYTQNGASGSIRKYFYDNSYGQYNLQLDVYGPVTISKGYAYYGQNKNDRDGADMHPDEMIVEACKAADQLGVDFSQYDYNNDGEVDWVVVVYAGQGEADSYIANTIWPHQYTLSSTNKSFQLDGKTIDRYCCTNEICTNRDGSTGGLAGIGVFVHEFSHILGLPDLYTTNSTDHKTLGMWDIMDYGCYNNDLKSPPMYSAYERWWMGWLQPELLNTAADITLSELSTGQKAGYINAQGEAVSNILSPYPTVFYMLENRQQTSWDTYLPGHGLLITKINYRYNWWNGNTINNTASNMGVDIIEADGLAPSFDSNNRGNGYFGKQGDAYPTESVTSFTQVTNYPITNIAENNGLITFKVNGGGAPILLNVETTEVKQPAQKILRDGKIVIIRGDKEYDILGHENHQL